MKPRNLILLTTLPTLFYLFFWLFYPFIYDIYYSAFYFTLTRPELTRFVGVENYIDVLTDPNFWLAARNTALFIVICLPLEFFLGLLLALVLSSDFKGIGILRTLYILPVLLPPVSVAIIWRLMFFPKMGAINYLIEALFGAEINWLAGGMPSFIAVVLIDVWQWAPFVALILLAGLLGMPPEPIEAAKIDGASPSQIFFNITLPYLRPIILVALMLRFLDLIKLFDPIYAIVTGGGSGLETLSIFIYRRGFKVLNIGFGATVSVIFWITAFIIANLVVRRFKEYLT